MLIAVCFAHMQLHIHNLHNEYEYFILQIRQVFDFQWLIT